MATAGATLRIFFRSYLWTYDPILCRKFQQPYPRHHIPDQFHTTRFNPRDMPLPHKKIDRAQYEYPQTPMQIKDLFVMAERTDLVRFLLCYTRCIISVRVRVRTEPPTFKYFSQRDKYRATKSFGTSLRISIFWRASKLTCPSAQRSYSIEILSSPLQRIAQE